MKHLTLALAALTFAYGCSDGSSSKSDAAVEPDDGGPGDVVDGDTQSEADAQEECVPLGCDEQGYECGIADDGCGNELDCTSVKTCVFPERCGDDFKCGCVPKSCELLTAEFGETACGAADDGCGGTIECGGCDGLGGDRWSCSDTGNVCQCAALPAVTTCGSRVCGAVDDGCGGEAECGSCSPARSCSDAGACACQARDSAYASTACAGKTCGTVVVDGCTFDCGTGSCGSACSGTSCSACECGAGVVCTAPQLTCCSPLTRDAACASTCGSVTDPCSGQVFDCGCAAGQACVDKAYLTGETSNKCVAQERANLLGGYVVRVHQYSDFILGLQRAETVSLVSIRQNQDGTVRMEDVGCVASTANSTGSVRSLAPAYFNIPGQYAQVTTAAGAFAREAWPNLEPTGFTSSLPTFCDGTSRTPTASADFDAYLHSVTSTVTPSSGSAKAWLPGGACRCPLTSETCAPGVKIDEPCLPKVNTTVASMATDCRLNDADADGRPGFSLITSSPEIVGAAITASSTSWSNGVIRADGKHTAWADPAKNFAQHFVACRGPNDADSLSCSLLNGAKDAPCRAEFDRVQFAKVSATEFGQLSCASFYAPGATLQTYATANSWSAVRAAVQQQAVDRYFDGSDGTYPTCSASAPCPDGMACKTGGRCVPKTSKGACASNADCGAGWECNKNAQVGPSCWPVKATCKAPSTPTPTP